MRIIWYMMDGLSSNKLTSLNDKGKTSKYNYFDEIIDKSMVIPRLYGAGETFASLASKLTGDSISKLQSDDLLSYNSFKSTNNIAKHFKEQYKTKNIFYRNYSAKYPTNGPYKRFNKLCTYGFDKYILAEDSRIDLFDSRILNEYNDYFEINNCAHEENKFIFIHDLYLHDHPTAYESTNYDDYNIAICEAAEHLKKNLEYLKFDEESDILIISSDHGLTVRPDSQMYHNKNITRDEYNIYKKSLYSETKLRAFISIYSKNIPNLKLYDPIIMKDANIFVKNTINMIKRNKFTNTSYKKEYIITSISDLTFGNTAPKALREKFHSHIICYHDAEKWIYTRWPTKKAYKANLYNDNELSEINYRDLPSKLKDYVEIYYSNYNFIKKTSWLVKTIYRYLRNIR